jgi:hypothetical protein
LCQVCTSLQRHLHQSASQWGDLATLKLVEMLTAAILVVMMLAIVAIATGYLPSRMG